MFVTFVFIVASFLVGYRVGKRVIRRQRDQPQGHCVAAAPPQTVARSIHVTSAPPPQPAASPIATRTVSDGALDSDEAFEKKYGELHCNGCKCNPEVQCNNGERLFCRDVMMKLKGNPGRAWVGQYWVLLLEKWRRVDFAVVTRAGKALAVEFDGYNYHAKLARDKFQDQLDRQNALLMNGWGVLRFSFEDVRQRPDQCVDIIRNAVYSAHSMCTATLKLPLFFADVSQAHDPDSAAGRSLCSGRNTRYIPITDMKKLAAFGQSRLWVPCPDNTCTGRVFRQQRGPYNNWYCDSCDAAYFDNRDQPPINKIISSKKAATS